MNSLSRVGSIAVLSLVGLAVLASHSQESKTTQKEPLMTNHATGSFAVKMSPQKPDNPVAEAAKFSRMAGEKEFHGDLEGSSKLEMLASSPDAKGSGVYVALERVNGTLKGRSGSFVLHHTGIMTRGVPQLSIEVAPDSGTDQLTGITGKMTINIAADGKHSYEFEYSLPQ
jgi:uncharacterized protein DUF3224